MGSEVLGNRLVTSQAYDNDAVGMWLAPLHGMSNLQPGAATRDKQSAATPVFQVAVRRLTALALVLGMILALGTDAEATPRRSLQRVRDAISEMNPLKQLTRQVRGFFSRRPLGALTTGEHPRMQFAERNPSKRSQRVFRRKPILVVGETQIDRYLRSVQDDSIEVIFMPHTIGGSMDTGHVAVRVGDRKLDMTTLGTRNQPFDQTREGYGFVFEVGAARVAEIQAAYDELILKAPRFTMTGTGRKNCYSCAGFITKVLETVAGDLGVQTTASAIGTAKMLARSDNHAAVTLYGEAAKHAQNEAYVFAKLE